MEKQIYLFFFLFKKVGYITTKTKNSYQSYFYFSLKKNHQHSIVLFLGKEKEKKRNRKWETRNNNDSLICSRFRLQRDSVRAATEFASRNQLPDRIQDQMLSHICLKFRTEGLKQQDTLNDLPKAIRASIAHYLFYPIVEKAYLFEGVSHDFLFQLVIILNPSFFFLLSS